jgi:hypothetical protein
MVTDVVYFAVTLLVIGLILKPLLVLAVLGLVCYLVLWVARLAYWLISLLPIWLDPENPGRLHRWPAGVNLVICMAIGVGIWLTGRVLLVSGLQQAASWLRGDAPDMPKASAKVVAVLDSIGDAALRAVAAIFHGLYWCLLQLHIFSDSWDAATLWLQSCWHRIMDPILVAVCPLADRTPATGTATAPSAPLPPGITCQIAQWGLYDIAALILVAAACVILFNARKGEARRLRGMERDEAVVPLAGHQKALP